MRIGFLIRALPLLLSGDLSFFKNSDAPLKLIEKMMGF